jgi:hypothetical protein
MAEALNRATVFALHKTATSLTGTSPALLAVVLRARDKSSHFLGFFQHLHLQLRSSCCIFSCLYTI